MFTTATLPEVMGKLGFSPSDSPVHFSAASFRFQSKKEPTAERAIGSSFYAQGETGGGGKTGSLNTNGANEARGRMPQDRTLVG
jgi:hypothetical protein